VLLVLSYCLAGKDLEDFEFFDEDDEPPPLPPRPAVVPSPRKQQQPMKRYSDTSDGDTYLDTYVAFVARQMKIPDPTPTPTPTPEGGFEIPFTSYTTPDSSTQDPERGAEIDDVFTEDLSEIHLATQRTQRR
jgi:hypothetical protein